MLNIIDLKDYIQSSLKTNLDNIEIKDRTIFLKFNKDKLINNLKFLKNDEKCLFSQLIDITAVDYINNQTRFEIVYIFLSLDHNVRLICKVLLNENENISSLCSIYQSANWYERECYDLFGVIFEDHPDLRRIMTDYNFVGHPLRKDFPLTGHNEVRYDDLQKKVVYEPVKLQQEYRNFDYSSPWEGFVEKINKDKIILSDKKNETD